MFLEIYDYALGEYSGKDNYVLGILRYLLEELTMFPEFRKVNYVLGIWRR